MLVVHFIIRQGLLTCGELALVNLVLICIELCFFKRLSVMHSPIHLAVLVEIAEHLVFLSLTRFRWRMFTLFTIIVARLVGVLTLLRNLMIYFINHKTSRSKHFNCPLEVANLRLLLRSCLLIM